MGASPPTMVASVAAMLWLGLDAIELRRRPVQTPDVAREEHEREDQ
jgi:hypothetical protein